MTPKYIYLNDFLVALGKDPNLKTQFTADPIGTMTGVAEIPNTRVYQILFVVLGLTVIIALTGMLILAWKKIDAPGSVVALASTALGALAGILAPAPPQPKN